MSRFSPPYSGGHCTSDPDEAYEQLRQREIDDEADARSEHEMKCIGLGKPVDSPLAYKVTFAMPGFIHRWSASCYASSRKQAEEMVRDSYPTANCISGELL